MTLRIIIKQSCIHFKYQLIATPMWAMISPCGHPKETFFASPLEVGVEISQVTHFAKCTGAKHLRVTASATWLQNCCWLWCSCSSVPVREVSCIYDTELDIATHLLLVVQIIPSVNVAALLRKSTATEFLQKVREKRTAECFPEDCSSEVGEVEEVGEEYVSFQLIVLWPWRSWCENATSYLFLYIKR